MKKIKLAVIFSLLAITIMNWYVFSEPQYKGLNLNLLTLSTEASASEWWWDDEERKESIMITCKATKVTTITKTYRDANGKIVGTFIFTNGALQSSAGIESGTCTETISESGREAFQGTKVNCPTDGTESCTPYDPCD